MGERLEKTLPIETGLPWNMVTALYIYNQIVIISFLFFKEESCLKIVKKIQYWIFYSQKIKDCSQIFKSGYSDTENTGFKSTERYSGTGT
jgi:hypothetical protein